MTRLAISDIPQSIQTVEALFVWAASVLDYTNKDAVSVEGLDANGVGVNAKCVTANVFYNDAPKETEYRFVSRGSLQVAPEYKLGQVWNYVSILPSTTPIPDSFKK